MSAARSLVSMSRLHLPLETRKPRTSLIDAEWDWIASHTSVEPTPSYGFQSSTAPSYVPTLGRHMTLVHTDTLKMPLPVLVLRNAPASQAAPADEPRPARSERPRQLTNEGTLAAQACEPTLKSVPPPPRRWSLFQLGILAATTLLGFVVGYGVLFATATSREVHLGGGAQRTQSATVAPPASVLVASATALSPPAPAAETVVVPAPARLEEQVVKRPSGVATRKAPTKRAPRLGRPRPQLVRRANPASDNPY